MTSQPYLESAVSASVVPHSLLLLQFIDSTFFVGDVLGFHHDSFLRYDQLFDIHADLHIRLILVGSSYVQTKSLDCHQV